MPRILNICVLSLFSLSIQAQPAETTARIIVTMGHYYGPNAPVLTLNDLTVTERFEPLPITSLTPFKGDRAALEIFLLVDNCSNCEGGPKTNELDAFVKSQPPETSIGVAYIQDGALKIAQEPVTDREKVIGALSPPAGGKPANPFAALKTLIDNWKQQTPRRAVVMITNGVDPAQEELHQNPLAEAAIASAEQAGITVFTLYHPSADYLQADFDKIYSGQVQIAHVAKETGGEGYFLGFGPLPSLGPFLEDIGEHLANQYLLEFRTAAASGTGELREVTVSSKNKNIDIMTPDRAWIPGQPGSR